MKIFLENITKIFFVMFSRFFFISKKKVFEKNKYLSRSEMSQRFQKSHLENHAMSANTLKLKKNEKKTTDFRNLVTLCNMLRITTLKEGGLRFLHKGWIPDFTFPFS